eukprot:4016511-Karenia_brevis.AAC.1
MVWIISDPRDSKFGQRVPAELFDEDGYFVELDGMGLVRWDEIVRVCKQVSEAGVDDEQEKLKKNDADVRLLGNCQSETGE